MIRLADGRTELYQWDTGRQVAFVGDCQQFHFTNKVYGRTMDVTAVKEGSNSVAKIPDVLLQSNADLMVYAYVGSELEGYTKIEKVFRVIKRNKPSDYVYTPEEQKTLKEIEETANKAKETADNASVVAKDAKETADSVRADADAGKFNGKPGDPGDPGEPGKDAPQIDDTQATTTNPWSGAKSKEYADGKEIDTATISVGDEIKGKWSFRNHQTVVFNLIPDYSVFFRYNDGQYFTQISANAVTETVKFINNQIGETITVYQSGTWIDNTVDIDIISTEGLANKEEFIEFMNANAVKDQKPNSINLKLQTKGGKIVYSNDADLPVPPSGGGGDDVTAVTNTITGNQLKTKITKQSGKEVESPAVELPVTPEYTLPKASNNTLGGVKVGEGLNVSPDGTLSTAGGQAEPPLTIVDTLPTPSKDEYDKGKMYLNGTDVSYLVGEPATEPTVSTTAQLPSPRNSTSSCVVGTDCYIFGGGGANNLSDILKFNTITREVKKLSSKLPSARQRTSACAVGTTCYIFAGMPSYSEIIKFDTITGEVNKLSATLPSPRYSTSSCSVGTNCYIFGGFGDKYLSDILKFDTITGQLTKLSSQLPSGRSNTSACSIGTDCYIFGGYDGTDYSDIIKFDTITGEVTKLSSVLPTDRKDTSACVIGTNCYIFGGQHYNAYSDIIKFDTITGEVTKLSSQLPSERVNTSACSVGKECYIFGGSAKISDGSLMPSSDIVQVSFGFTYKYETTSKGFEAPTTADNNSYLSVFNGKPEWKKELPKATETNFGAVKAVTATSEMTDDVGIDSTGKLKVKPSGGGGGGVGEKYPNTDPTEKGGETFNDYKNNIASGSYSHAEGNSCKATAYASHAEGIGCEASELVSHAEGHSCKASGQYSHAEGDWCESSGQYSHAEGNSCKATASRSHAEGDYCKATAYASHAEGSYCESSGQYSHVEGKYNKKDLSSIYQHIAGNGSNDYDTDRSNSYTLDWQGNGTYAGTVNSTSGADYAEYFEWLDGNVNDEDRVGRAVTLEGAKIRYANSGEDVLGFVSGTAAVIGDTAEWEWTQKYITDDFGRVVWHMEEEFVDIPNEDGATTRESIGFFPARTINPNYDESKDYVRREDRKEWDTIGIIGKIHALDDGNCEINKYAKVGQDGILTLSIERTNIRVMKRITDNIVLVLVK